MYGMTTILGVSFQNSYGTKLTNSVYWLPFLSESVQLTKNQLISQGMRGIYDEGDHFEGVNEVSGDIEIEAHPISLGVLLKAICGAPTTTSGAGGLQTHVFRPRTSDFDRYALGHPLTIVKGFGDGGSAHQYYDMVATALNLSIANGEFARVSMSVLGGKYAQDTEPSASYPVGDLFTWDVASVSLGGSANGDIKELNVALEEPAENHYTLNGAKTPSRTKRSGFRTLSIDGTLVFDNQTEYQKFVAQSEQALVMTMTTANSEAFTIKVPSFRYTEFPLTADGPGKVEVAFSGKGVYSISSATAIEFVLVNTQVAY